MILSNTPLLVNNHLNHNSNKLSKSEVTVKKIINFEKEKNEDEKKGSKWKQGALVVR